MARKLLRRNLKIGIYSSPQCGSNHFEQYIIETQADLKAYLDALDPIKPVRNILQKNMTESLNRGEILIANDEHPVSGFPTYCMETTNPEPNPHPNSHIRVRVLTNQN